MKTIVGDFSLAMTDFEDCYLEADMSSLSVFLVESALKGRELEIRFSPVPICYRYTVEESFICSKVQSDCKHPGSIQTLSSSDWIDSLELDKSPEYSGLRHYKIRLSNQVFDVMSRYEPSISWRKAMEIPSEDISKTLTTNHSLN